VLVPQRCKGVFESLRPHLIDPIKTEKLADLLQEIQNCNRPTNVVQVRQLSPFRYPGGKIWLVPEVRQWLITAKQTPSIFVEPFAGGAMAGLTAAAEGLAERVLLCELDEDGAAVWGTIFDGTDEDVKWLCKEILQFKEKLNTMRDVLASNPKSERGRAFCTIVKNRMQRGGIMAARAGLVKAGKNGRGLHLRWYPETLAKRIEIVRTLRDRISFKQGDGFKVVP